MTKTTPQQEREHESVEKCIAIMNESMLKSSYAAPREAFRKVLREALAQREAEIAEAVEKLKYLEAATSPGRLDLKQSYNRALEKVINLLTPSE